MMKEFATKIQKRGEILFGCSHKFAAQIPLLRQFMDGTPFSALALSPLLAVIISDVPSPSPQLEAPANNRGESFAEIRKLPGKRGQSQQPTRHGGVSHWTAPVEAKSLLEVLSLRGCSSFPPTPVPIRKLPAKPVSTPASHVNVPRKRRYDWQKRQIRIKSIVKRISYYVSHAFGAK